MEVVTDLPPHRDWLMVGIYRIRMIEDPEGRAYIGSSQTVQIRLRWHRRLLNRGKHHCQYLQRAWLKYGEEAFVFELIEPCWLGELNDREQAWMDLYGAERLFNSRYLADSQRGYQHTPQTRAKMSASQKAYAASEGYINPFEGKTHSPATRARIVAANTGRKASLATRAKQSASLKGRPHTWSIVYTPEMREATSERIRGSKNPRAILTEDQVVEIRQLFADGVSRNELAATFGVCWGTIDHIVKRIIWRHIP